MIKRIVILLIVLAAIGGGVYYFKSQGKQPIVLTGIVTGDEYIVSAQIQGRLQKLDVREGDAVHQGDLLAEIEPETWAADMAFYDQSVEQAKMQVQQAESDLKFTQDQSRSQVTQAEANLDAAVAQVGAVQGGSGKCETAF